MRKFLLIIAAVLMPLTAVASIAHAATSSDTKPGQGMSLTPPVVELKADPGQTVTTELKLRNDLRADLLVKPQSNDFTSSDSTDEQGVPKLIDNSVEPGPHTLRQYIEPLPETIVKGQETHTYKVVINVPKDAQPGAHYGVVRFTGQPTGGENVTISASIGSLIFLNVSGDAKDHLKLEQFYTSDKDGNRTWFFEYGPITINEWLKNDGNTVLAPSGKIEIYDIFGHKVTTLPFNEQVQNKEKAHYVLPDTTRKFHQTYDKTWLLGPYTAKLILSYGANGTTFANEQLTFWVIPWKLILLIIVLTILIVWLTRRGIKKYNKRIVEKDRRRTGR